MTFTDILAIIFLLSITLIAFFYVYMIMKLIYIILDRRAINRAFCEIILPEKEANKNTLDKLFMLFMQIKRDYPRLTKSYVGLSDFTSRIYYKLLALNKRQLRMEALYAIKDYKEQVYQIMRMIDNEYPYDKVSGINKMLLTNLRNMGEEKVYPTIKQLADEIINMEKENKNIKESTRKSTILSIVGIVLSTIIGVVGIILQ